MMLTATDLAASNVETWTDVAQCADMKVAGTDDGGYMPVHSKCLIELNTKKLN